MFEPVSSIMSIKDRMQIWLFGGALVFPGFVPALPGAEAAKPLAQEQTNLSPASSGVT